MTVHTSQSTASITASIGIIGGSGYTGAALAEILLRHPAVTLAAITSERLAGESVHQHLPRLLTDLRFCPEAELPAVDLAFVCLPHGDAARIVKRLLDQGVRVVDLSADYRLPADVYEQWYQPHPHPELAPGVYGLTEVYRDQVATAQLVANPGCYPTAARLGIAPLKPLGLVDVIVDAKSGVSGAGKSPNARTHFCAIDSDLMPYGIGKHRHQPEIEALLDAETTLTFVPHLVPLQRGISETIYVRTKEAPALAEVQRLYHAVYDHEPFVEVSDTVPELKDVVNTNRCRVYVTRDDTADRFIIVSVIDNLLKGAAGQAMQNMNVMLGFDETAGLA